MEEYNKKNIFIALVGVVVVFSTIVWLVYLLSGSTKGSLTITSSPSDALVLVDDKESGKTPTTISDLKKGKHKVTVKKEGLSDATQEVTIKKGENKVSLNLSPSTVDGDIFKNRLLVLNTKFEIRQSKRYEYVVALKAIYNKPSQYDSYLEQLKKYKLEALDWLRANNVDLTKANIEYVPKEAKDL